MSLFGGEVCWFYFIICCWINCQPEITFGQRRTGVQCGELLRVGLIAELPVCVEGSASGNDSSGEGSLAANVDPLRSKILDLRTTSSLWSVGLTTNGTSAVVDGDSGWHSFCPFKA